jgi:hypothetical protein
VPTFADRGVPHGQRGGSLRPYSWCSRPDFNIIGNLNYRCKYSAVFAKMKYRVCQFVKWSGDSAVGIATGRGLDDRGVGIRVPVGSRMFSSI